MRNCYSLWLASLLLLSTTVLAQDCENVKFLAGVYMEQRQNLVSFDDVNSQELPTVDKLLILDAWVQPVRQQNNAKFLEIGQFKIKHFNMCKRGYKYE